MKFLTFLGTALLAAATLSRAQIPAARLVDWTPGVAVGVPGGIPTNRSNQIDVTAAPYNADKTGATNASPAIQAAINTANPGDVVYLPAGTYRIEGTLNLGPSRSGITLRGAGDGTVVMNYTTSTGIFVGTNSDYAWSWPNTGNTITAGATKGSTQITIADTSAFNVGQIIRIKQQNDSAVPVVSVVGYENLRRQTSRVTAKSGNTLTIAPALYTDYSAQPATVYVAQFQANSIGIENMLIDSSNAAATFTIWMEQCYACWVKNVHVKLSANYHIFLNDSLNCEVRHCFLDQLNHVGSNGAGILCGTISACLVEDNIIYKAFPLIEVNHGSSGNVFAYNLLEDSSPGVAIDTNHGPHNSFNLYEGNVAPNLQADGYFGSVSDDTIFRNWLHGHQPGATSAGWCLSLNRFTRNYSLVGNIIGMSAYPSTYDGCSYGNPNMGNSAYTGSAPPWTDGWVTGPGTLSQSGSAVSTTLPIFTSAHVGQYIMTPTNAVVALITAYTDPQHVTVNSTASLTNVGYIVTPGSAGYQELDTAVLATLYRDQNFYTWTGTVPSSESSGTALPASLYRTAKPGFFGSLSWPAFDSHAPNQNYDAIPAGYRWVHGTDPAGVTTDPTTTSGTTSGGTTSGTSTTSTSTTSTTSGTGTTTTSSPQLPLNVRVSQPLP